MEPNENTKSGPKQILGQNVGHVEQESPRTCKICGGPNHLGCGCEAKQRRTVGMTEPTGPQPAEPTGPQPAEPKPAETADNKSSAIIEAIKVDEKLKSLAIDFAAAKVTAEIIRCNAEQITSLLSDILELLKTIHNYLMTLKPPESDKVQNGKADKN